MGALGHIRRGLLSLQGVQFHPCVLCFALALPTARCCLSALFLAARPGRPPPGIFGPIRGRRRGILAKHLKKIPFADTCEGWGWEGTSAATALRIRFLFYIPPPLESAERRRPPRIRS